MILRDSQNVIETTKDVMDHTLLSQVPLNMAALHGI